MILETIHPEICKADQWEKFKNWLVLTGLNPREKKELLCEWCELSGVKLTRERVKEIGGI